MKYNTNNLRIVSSSAVIAPNALMQEYLLNDSGSKTIFNTRAQIKNILTNKDKRLMVVIGPCSIHDPDAAREYASKLVILKKKMEQDLLIVMRVYFEKPRTTIGWKGLINDPHLDESFDIDNGLKITRKLLLDLTTMGMPAAVEFLDLITPQYISDLVSWGAIGARTTESQSHRELASILSFPVGFKNGTTGSTKIAVDAIKSANSPHHLLSINQSGNVGHHISKGNKTAHIILRGGNNNTNYGEKYIKQTVAQLKEKNLLAKIMVDCSHDNSQKQFKNQLIVGKDISNQIEKGCNDIFGVMIESNLNEGRQEIGPLKSLKYGVSITDACINWEDSEKLLKILALASHKRILKNIKF